METTWCVCVETTWCAGRQPGAGCMYLCGDNLVCVCVLVVVITIITPGSGRSFSRSSPGLQLAPKSPTHSLHRPQGLPPPTPSSPATRASRPPIGRCGKDPPHQPRLSPVASQKEGHVMWRVRPAIGRPERKQATSRLSQGKCDTGGGSRDAAGPARFLAA